MTKRSFKMNQLKKMEYREKLNLGFPHLDKEPKCVRNARKR